MRKEKIKKMEKVTYSELGDSEETRVVDNSSDNNGDPFCTISVRHKLGDFR